MNPIIKKISDMSSKNRYLSKYSGDVFLAILLLIILFLIYAYFQLQNIFQPIRNDWENQKCKTIILPISGFIRPSKYESQKGNMEYTADNYKECMEKTSFTILKPMTVPFDIIINSIKSLFASISDITDMLYQVIEFLRKILTDIMEFFFGIIKMLIKILTQIMAAIGNFFYKGLLIFFVGLLIVKAIISSTVATLVGFIKLVIIFLGSLFLLLGVLQGVVAFLAPSILLWPLLPAAITAVVIMVVCIVGVIVLWNVLEETTNTLKDAERKRSIRAHRFSNSKGVGVYN
tara:strand:- start:459 stop:1325 length:867 start_codon:yes stop_codon:yes gene_type:complete